jgi:hypothetical protein
MDVCLMEESSIFTYMFPQIMALRGGFPWVASAMQPTPTVRMRGKFADHVVVAPGLTGYQSASRGRRIADGTGTTGFCGWDFSWLL